jgi:hypothetical protein
MTFRIPTLLAVTLLVAGHAAYASSPPTTTDAARDQAHRLVPQRSSIPAPDFTAMPTTSDEARDLAHGLLPTQSTLTVADTTATPVTSDEARELAHGMLP